jgi:formylglycine-generating enzyme required for sulfatase activity
LYPLCAAIILLALFFSFGNPFAGKVTLPVTKQEDAKSAAPAEAPKRIPVTFDVQPDAKGLEVASGGVPVPANPEGNYAFAAGHYALTFKKDGFTPVAKDVDISATANKFDVKFEPVVKYNDVTLQIAPPNAELKVDGVKQDLANGSFTQKVAEGQPLQIEVTLDKYEPISRTISSDELKTLANKVAVNLKQIAPPVVVPTPPPVPAPETTKAAKVTLPASLFPKPGAPKDPQTRLPVRALAKKFADEEQLEFALVTPGTYKYGAPVEGRRPNELSEQTLEVYRPYYVAIHETTNAQYKKFADAVGEDTAGTRWEKSSHKWAPPQKLDPVNNQLPVANVTPEEAVAFCKWVGGQLPSEKQWECAVRGVDDNGFPRPWGKSEPTRDRCRIFYGEHLERGEGGPLPVDRMSDGANQLGMTHALGNVAEWCFDSEKDRGFILRGCSIATANINDVRVTWRAPGDSRGEESSGFRALVEVHGPAFPDPAKTTSTKPPAPTGVPAPPVPQEGSLPSFTWEQVVNALTSPSTGSDAAVSKPPAK